MQDEFGNSFSVLSRLGYLCYWFFDNIGTLVDLKIIKISRDREQITSLGLKFKIVGLIFGLILAFRNWIHAAHKQVIIEKKLLSCSEDEMNQ